MISLGDGGRYPFLSQTSILPLYNYHGGDANSFILIPIVLSSIEAEYMPCFNFGGMITHLD